MIRHAGLLLLLLATACGGSAPDPKPLVAKGRRIFAGKGNCLLCHTVGGGTGTVRGTDLEAIGAKDAAYLVRALVKPAADVPEGYNPMPESWLPSGLDPDEIVSVICYLQSLGGTPDPSRIHLPEEWMAARRRGYERELRILGAGDPARGAKLFADRKSNAACIRCHTMDGEGARICPDLTRVKLVQRPAYVLQSILDSSAFLVRNYRQIVIWDTKGRTHVGLRKAEDAKTLTLIVDDKGTTETIPKAQIDERQFSKTSKMPGNFAEILTAQQVMDLVAYVLRHDELLAAKKRAEEKKKTEETEETAPPPLEVFGKVTADQKLYRTAMARGDPRIGRRIYAHYCVMCHGAKGTGTGFNAVNLATKPANHTDNRRMAKTEDRLLHGVIANGGNKTGRSFLMPPWGGTLSDQDIWDLVAHLRTLHTAILAR